MTTSIMGMLEVDSSRGIVYFHASPVAIDAGFPPTPLRICGLEEIPFSFRGKQLDITIRTRKNTPPHDEDKEVFVMVTEKTE